MAGSALQYTRLGVWYCAGLQKGKHPLHWNMYFMELGFKVSDGVDFILFTLCCGILSKFRWCCVHSCWMRGRAVMLCALCKWWVGKFQICEIISYVLRSSFRFEIADRIPIGDFSIFYQLPVEEAWEFSVNSLMVCLQWMLGVPVNNVCFVFSFFF